MDESKESFNGSAALPLKNGLNTTDNVKITLDLVKFGKKVGDVEVTYKYIYRQKQQASNGSPLFSLDVIPIRKTQFDCDLNRGC